MTVRFLNLENKNIVHLNGLDKFTNLSSLNLANNQINNLFYLRKATKLVTLNLSNNQISNLAPLSSLENLLSIDLGNNFISDVAPLSKLTKLKIIDVRHNSISDISSFSTLSELMTLYLQENRIEDVGCLSKLEKLENLDLKNQTYEYSVTGNVLANINTNVNLPTFFIQAKQVGSLHYTPSSFTVSGATLSNNSRYLILRNTTSGEKTATVKINGGIADGSIMTLKYNNVLVTVSPSTSTPNPIYEGVGGTISFVVTADGETSMKDISIQITKNNIDVTNLFQLTKTNLSATSSKIYLKVSDQIEAGTYSLCVRYQNKTAVKGNFTIAKAIPVTGIRLNVSELTLALHSSQKLEATVLPSNALNQKVIWSSSNSSIVSVDSTGKVTAQNYGDAVVTATTEDGNKTASCTITVPKPVTGVSLNLTHAVVILNETKQLIATITPSDATNQELIWQTNNPTVATISENGLIEGKSVGYAVITVTTKDGNHSASCSVTVKEKDIPVPEIISVESILLNKTTLTLVQGKSETLLATILPENATNKVAHWASSHPEIASVDGFGKVTAHKVGSTQIIVTAQDSSAGTKQAICEVTVTTNEITSSTYVIEGNRISNISPNQNLQEVIAHLNVPLSYKIYDVKGNEVLYNTLIGTGMQIVLEDNSRYSFVVTGDITGDGKITASDILSLKKHIVKVSPLVDAYEKAADVNHNTSITSTDLFQLKKAAVGLIKL